MNQLGPELRLINWFICGLKVFRINITCYYSNYFVISQLFISKAFQFYQSLKSIYFWVAIFCYFNDEHKSAEVQKRRSSALDRFKGVTNTCIIKKGNKQPQFSVTVLWSTFHSCSPADVPHERSIWCLVLRKMTKFK